MNDGTPRTNLTDAEIRAIIDDTEKQALGGAVGAIARAGLGTMAIVLAVFAATNAETVGLFLLCGLFLLSLAAYIRSVARSVAGKPRFNARPARPAADAPAAPLETAPVTPAPSESAGVAPAVPSTTLGPIAGGSWSRLSQR